MSVHVFFSESVINYVKKLKEQKRIIHEDKYNPIEYDALIKETAFLPEDAPIKQRIYHVLYNIVEIPLCPQCHIKPLNWQSVYKTDNKYGETCSIKCSVNYSKKQRIAKRKINILSDKPKIELTRIELIEYAKQCETKGKGASNEVSYKTPKYLALVEATNFLPNHAPMSQRIYHILNDIYDIPKCPVCKQASLNWHVSIKANNKYAVTCSPKCGGVNEDAISKRQQTCLTAYGVNSYSKTNKFKTLMSGTLPSEDKQKRNDNREKTCIERYGVAHTSQVPEFNKKRQQTCLEKYGHTNYLASEHNNVQQKCLEKNDVKHFNYTMTFKERMELFWGNDENIKNNIIKQKQTCLAKYGVDSYSKTPEFVEQFQQTRTKKNHELLSSILFLEDKDWLIQHHHTNKQTASSIADELGVHVTTVISYIRKHDITQMYYTEQSQPERDITKILSQYNISIITNTRNVITPYELDIFLPDYNIAIEYCGLYWHSDVNKPTKYHKMKFDKCAEQGIRLITIFEDEWVGKQSLVLSKIFNILHISSEGSIYARKCDIRPVPAADKKTFYNKWHIQGNGPGSLTYGLYHNVELVAVITFIQKQNKVYELNRFATSQHVVGGFSKLLKHFMRNNDWGEIISYADLRWSIGNLYEQNGFNNIKIVPPTYEYIINNKRAHRSSFMRKNLPIYLGELFNPNLTEFQNMDNAGILRIWNCGLLKYTIKNPE